MRITFHGYKGGVGKSTLALMLAKALAERGKKVLFIDRDVMTYASQLAGIKDEGLFVQIALGKTPENFYKTIKLGNGQLKIVKMFSLGIDYYKAMHHFNKVREFIDFYTKFLKEESFDYMVIDNPVFLTWENNPIRYEAEAFKSVFPNERSKVILVTDPLPYSIDDSVVYLRRISSESPIAWDPLAGIINMAVEEKQHYLEDIKKLMNFLGFPIGVIVSFYDKIFQFYGKIEDLEVVPEIRQLAERILSGEIRKEEIIL